MNNKIEARPFEEYKEMIKSMSKEEMIKGLYDLSKSCIENEKRIEKLEQEYIYEYNLRHKLSLDLSVEKDKVLELSNHLTMYSSEETMLKEIERLNNIINELHKLIEQDWGYYGSFVYNSRAEFDDEEQVNKFWQDYGKKEIVKKYRDKLKELKGDSSNE